MILKDNGLSIRRQCKLLGINRSGLYYETAEPEEACLMLEEELMARIDYWHTKCPYFGSRKILDKLRKEGYVIGRKKIRRLMWQMGIVAIYPVPIFLSSRLVLW